MNARTRVAVVSGGTSSEHDVSVASGAAVAGALDPSRYDMVELRIGRDGRWGLADRPLLGDRSGTLAAAIRVLGNVDVVFPALHGPDGEDGTLAALLELVGVPYVGCGVCAGAVGMDKVLTKTVLAAAGLAVAEGVVLRPGDDVTVAAPLGSDVFVKPARAGSSIGVSRVVCAEDLPAAVAAARLHDPVVLVEAAVPGREIDVGVLEACDGSVHVSPPLEIVVPSTAQFFDHGAKYADSATRFLVPAPIDPATTRRLRDVALRAFDALGCAGLLRVDMFLRPDATVVVNEVNTMPGFTAASQFPRMWAATGLDFAGLLDVLVDSALGRARRAATSRPLVGCSSTIGSAP